ncbi:MAG TPA: RidA family protein, partial [Gammaproteobacteria bacterium]|nr:RidA family protein [Gammaproteobacteria bacterium]
MNHSANPSTVHKPLGRYCHTTLVPADARWLVLSGQVGINSKGQLATGIRKQTEQTFRNILACLRAQGMRKKDLVKTTVYLTDSRFADSYRQARSKVIGD